MKKFIGQLMLVGCLLLATENAHALPFTVDAMANSSSGGVGVNTGVVLALDEAFTVTTSVDDLWSAGPLPRWSNADGLVGNLLATGSDESGQAAGTLIGVNFGLHTQNGLSAAFGTLVGELSGTFFKLGTVFSGMAPAAGTLKLYYWDGNNGDNSGTVLADVQTKGAAVPEPGTYFLLLLGFGMVCLAARKYQLV